MGRFKKAKALCRLEKKKLDGGERFIHNSP